MDHSRIPNYAQRMPILKRWQRLPATLRPILLSVSLMLLGACQSEETRQPMTSSQAHCTQIQPDCYYRPARQLGGLFEAVQLQRVFSDGKTFVDSRPKYDLDTILAHYRQTKDAPDFDLHEFVAEHFDAPSVHIDEFQLDSQLSMEAHLRQHWSYLTRQADEKAGLSTLIPLPHPYIVPGGRFREIYYWDSYFTMRGLAASGRDDLLVDMLNNFAWLIDEVGHIPNGNRVYYLSRSQPPFFAAMVTLLREQKGDRAALRYLPQLEREYAFWMDGASALAAGEEDRRVVRMADGSLLNRYYDDLDTPRPESYREDLRTGYATEPDARPQLYRDIRAAAESGWDFSSRWMSDSEDLTSIHTTAIVPADLNSLLYHTEVVISELAAVAGQHIKAQQFAEKAQARRAAIHHWLWSADSGTFRDYSLITHGHTPVISLATVYPLYFHVATDDQARKVAEQLEQTFLMPGGLVTTLRDTDEQWDYPNGWAPLQWLAIKGLSDYGHQRLSNEVAERWVALNRRVFESSARMMEKYNVVDTSLSAGGGEYALQDGFGWTNGVVLAIDALRQQPAVRAVNQR